MKRIVFTVITLLVLAGPAVWAQKGKALKQIPKNIEVFRPEALDRPISQDIANALVTSHGQKVRSETFVKGPWDVYSDRDNNTTYAEAKEKNPYGSLSMGEKVRIAKIKGEFALVYAVDETDDTPYPRLPKQVDWKGWVPVNRLILWNKPLVNNEGMLRRVLLSAAAMEATPSEITGKLYRSPIANAVPVTSLPAFTPNTFFYIVKSEGNMSLLSKDKELGENLENLYGWVCYDSYLGWDNNLAIEPTWDINNVKEFSAIGFFSEIRDMFSGNKVGKVDFKAKEMPFYRTDFYRIPGGVWRFPFNETSNSTDFCALVPVSSPYLSLGLGNGNDKDLSNVNIYFVMDGSRDLEDFFPAVLESFKDAEEVMPGLSIKVGAAIYHDQRIEDFKVEFCPATELRNRSMKDFIDQGGEYGFQDNTGEPALYEAIDKVLSDGGLRPSETNVIIIVGARGDVSDTQVQELADRLDGNNVSLFGIQVQNNTRTSSYQLFSFQVQNLINAKLSSRISKTGTERDLILRSVWHKDNISVVNYSLNTIEHSYADDQRGIDYGLMEEGDFTACLKEIYTKIFSSVDAQRFESTDNGGRSQLFYPYYMQKADQANRPFFKYVAMYDEDEFESMMTGFKDLYAVATTAADPVRAACDVVMGFLDVVPDSSPIKSGERGFYEALRLYEGLSVLPNSYKGESLRNVRELKNISEKEVRRLLDDFCLKYDKLLEIKNAPYSFMTFVNGRRCYWIPVEYMP